MKKILFITPFGGITGSEIMLLNLVNQLNENESYEAFFFSCQKGALIEKNSTNKHIRYFDPNPSFFTKVFRKIFSKHSPLEQTIRKLHKEFKPDYWYINTIVLPDVCSIAKSMNVDYFIHFHELPSMYQEISSVNWNEQLKNAKSVIACSEIVETRINQAGYQNEITVIPECIDTKNVVPGNKEAFHKKYNLPSNAVVWIMSGMTTYRKGVDLIPDIFENLPENHYLFWIGTTFENGLLSYIKERSKREFNNRIQFVGEKHEAEYYDFFANCDGFSLTSREDPYPLVMIEAALYGKPIISFNSGGAKEFIEDEMGIVCENVCPIQMAKNMVLSQTNDFNYSPSKAINKAKQHDTELICSLWIERFGKNLIQ